MTTETTWPMRIVGLTFEPPEQLLANPRNWRIHPGEQQQTLRDLLGRVGWITGVIQNDITGHLIDGHDRVENAISEGQPLVPVIHVELSEELEEEALASFDAVGLMAARDEAKLQDLVADVGQRTTESVNRLLQTMAETPRWPQLEVVTAEHVNNWQSTTRGRARWTVMFERAASDEVRQGLIDLREQLGQRAVLTWLQD